VFNVMLAVGSVVGALLAATREHTRLRLIVLAGAAFGLCQVAAAVAPGLGFFLVLLVGMGLTNLAFQAMANSSVQLWSDPHLRGRIMGLYMLVFTGGTPIGAPLIGAITSHFGPRVGMSVCGVIPAATAAALAAAHARRSSTKALPRTPTEMARQPVDNKVDPGVSSMSMPE
jgi:MFS family permease